MNEQPLQEAAVPGLGVFYIGEQDGKNKILFKETMPTDKAFLNFFAFEENLGEEEARTEIEKWVRKVTSELKANGNVQIAKVGSFEITGGKVVFTPAPEEMAVPDQHFGLESPSNPVPAASSPTPSPAPVPVPLPPVNTERPRPNSQRRPLNPPVKRPQPAAQPTSSGKEILLGDRRKPLAGKSRKKENAFYSQWWFLLVCLVVVSAFVLFGIRPVREKICSVFKPKTTEMRMAEEGQAALAALEEGIDKLINDEDDMPLAAEEAEPVRKEEDVNAEVARQVKAGQEAKKRQEVQARQAQPAKPATAKPAAKPAPKPRPAAKAQQPVKSRPEAKQVPVQKAGIQKPVPGKYYLIVGGFAVEDNARKKSKALRADGYGATILYMEAKNMYYVSVRTCSSKDEALKERAAFRNKNVDCWIFAN